MERLLRSGGLGIKGPDASDEFQRFQRKEEAMSRLTTAVIVMLAAGVVPLGNSPKPTEKVDPEAVQPVDLGAFLTRDLGAAECARDMVCDEAYEWVCLCGEECWQIHKCNRGVDEENPFITFCELP
jgi:hypothetical protein